MLLLEIQIYDRQAELLRQAAAERLAAEAMGPSPTVGDALRKLGNWCRAKFSMSPAKPARTRLTEATPRVRI
jgi:hypothetical protein